MNNFYVGEVLLAVIMAKKRSSSRKRSNPSAVKKKTPLDNKMMIGLIVIAIAIVGIVAGVLFLNQSPEDTDENQNNMNGENPIATIDTSMGSIKVELYEDITPNTVENFIKLANDGFYDGLIFHRVIDGFMIQGGGFEPDGTPKTSPYGSIDLEIPTENGNVLVEHVDGAIAMARTSDPNSATNQFFINDGAQPQLEPGGVDPNGYAAFGVVIDGMDVVGSISAVDTTTKNGMQNWPVDNVIINSITIQE